MSVWAAIITRDGIVLVTKDFLGSVTEPAPGLMKQLPVLLLRMPATHVPTRRTDVRTMIRCDEILPPLSVELAGR